MARNTAPPDFSNGGNMDKIFSHLNWELVDILAGVGLAIVYSLLLRAWFNCDGRVWHRGKSGKNK